MESRKYFLAIIILFIVLLLTFFLGNTSLWDFIFISICLLIGFISYNLGSKNGLIFGMFGSLLYGTLLLYLSLANYIISSDFSYYAWIILLPASTIIFGLYGDHINDILRKNQNFQKYIMENMYIDPTTNLPTRSEFYRNFSVESKLLEKQKYPLTIMLVKLDYRNELRDILGMEEFSRIIKGNIDKIEEIIGYEYRKYFIDGGKIGIFLNFISGNEAERLKTKILKSFEEAVFLSKRKEKVKFKLRIITREYDMSDPMDFVNSMDKDFEYEN